MVDYHKKNSCTLNLTLRGLITYICLWIINLQSFSHSKEKGNLKKYGAYFVKTCNNASIKGLSQTICLFPLREHFLFVHRPCTRVH